MSQPRTTKSTAKKTASKRTSPRRPTAKNNGVQPAAAAAVPLAEFLDSAGTLTLEQRWLLVDQALVLLGENYVHLP
jgi:hypothetical protein